MFFTIDDILSNKTWNVNVLWITSIKNGDDKKTAPNYELLLYQGDGGRPLIETFTSVEERSNRRDEIVSAGNYFILDDIHYNICWVQSIGKIEAGSPLVEGNLAQSPLCSITFANGRVLYGQFDSESERDDFYDLLLSLGIGGGGGGTPTSSGGRLVQKATKNDFPTQGDTKNTYVAKDTNTMYYWDATANEYKPLGSVSSGDAVLTEKIVSNVVCGAASASSIFPKDMTFTEFAKKLLLKDVAPSISATFRDNNSTGEVVGLKEKGTNITGVYFSATISTGTMDRSKLKEVNFYVGNTKVKTVAIGTGNTYTYTYVGAITTNVVVKVELVYDGSKKASTQAAYDFIYARFFGVTKVDIDSTNINSFITGATKSLAKGNSYTGITDLDDERFVYAYPASYSDLKSVKDGNGFEQLDGYTPDIVTLSYPTNGDSVQYKVYTLDDPATGNGFKQIYS